MPLQDGRIADRRVSKGGPCTRRFTLCARSSPPFPCSASRERRTFRLPTIDRLPASGDYCDNGRGRRARPGQQHWIWKKQLAAKKRRNHKEKKDLRWKRFSPYGWCGLKLHPAPFV